MNESLQGWVCMCSQGRPGLVTSAEKVLATYGDGAQAMAWVGIHLDPDMFGLPWSSRNPKPMYRAYDPHRAAERP